tara:strand:+ start:301 stop:444 length:144 start_codon:yes stop_codon:yes gene_type:complete
VGCDGCEPNSRCANGHDGRRVLGLGLLGVLGARQGHAYEQLAGQVVH